MTGLRFVPAGLIVISTQLDNNAAYLAPALLYGVVYTFVMLGLGAELGHMQRCTEAGSDRRPGSRDGNRSQVTPTSSPLRPRC